MSASEAFLNGGVTLHRGDCLAILPALAASSVDACVTDPPYELGFMGRAWDRTGIAFRPETWAETLRVLKPGGHLLAFAAPRNAHRMFCAIEDAGFEVRDCLQWIFGAGFPKSHDVSKGIDKANGVRRGTTPDFRNGPNTRQETKGGGKFDGWRTGQSELDSGPVTGPARQWEGWGTALKPAYEPIVLARKPLDGTVAANVLRWGTGALNIDGCRIPTNGEKIAPRGSMDAQTDEHEGWSRPWMADKSKSDARLAKAIIKAESLGRWPANILHDGSDEVVGAFPETSVAGSSDKRAGKPSGILGKFAGSENIARSARSEGGSAARFFYSAKADADDRVGSRHPTVKPLDLMRYLVRLVTPPGGTVLDPFAGSGTTGEAAWREGFRAVLIEREAEYQADIARRMKLCLAGPEERAREAIKARVKDKPADAGPLFGGEAA